MSEALELVEKTMEEVAADPQRALDPSLDGAAQGGAGGGQEVCPNRH